MEQVGEAAIDERIRQRLRNFAIGAAIQNTRKRRAVPKHLLARQIRVSTRTLMDYESGDDLVPAPKLYEIAEALDVPVTDLFRELACVIDDLRD